jgi:hypothetical protein
VQKPHPPENGAKKVGKPTTVDPKNGFRKRRIMGGSFEKERSD